MPVTIDARGLSCPQPVLMTLEEIEKEESKDIIILVDNNVARENVARALTSKNFIIYENIEESGTYRVKASIKK